MSFFLFGARGWTLIGAGLCTLTSLVTTARLLMAHLRNWSVPKEQLAIAIIVAMPPFYAAVALIGLIDARGSAAFFSLLEALKECYEALVGSFHSSLLLTSLFSV